MRGLSALAVLASVPALGFGSIEGVGRVTAQAGYRWAPDPHFAAAAAAVGTPLVSAPGGAQGAVSFGYGATEWLEAAVDVFGAVERFALDGLEPFTSAIWGALFGVRLSQQDVFFPGFIPYAGIQAGPAFASITSPVVAKDVTQWALSLNGGFTVRVGSRFGLSFDVRYVLARAYFPGIAGLNVGGGFFSVGFTSLFAPAPKQDLPVPGF